MKKTAAILLTVILLSSIYSPALSKADSTDRISNAYQIKWAGEDYAVLNETRKQPLKLVRVSTGEVLLDQIEYIVATGRYACAEASDGTWLIDSAGNLTLLKVKQEDSQMFIPLQGKYGLFFGEYNEELCIYDPSSDTFTFIPDQFTSYSEIYADDQGTVYVLTGHSYRTMQIYRADGKLILDNLYYDFVPNCDCEFVTNGYLTVEDERGAVVLSAYTGEEICRFDQYFWEPYDDDHQTYQDNTACIGKLNQDGYVDGMGTMIVGLDGTILKKLPEGQNFKTRFSINQPEPVYSIEVPADDPYNGGGFYNVLTDRTYMDYYETEESDGEEIITKSITTCLETGEQFSWDPVLKNYSSLKTGKTYNSFSEIINESDPIPERLEKNRPINQRVPWAEYTDEGETKLFGPDGTLMGGKYWKELPWLKWGRGYLSGLYPFDGISVCAVRDKNDLCGAIDLQGNMIVPAEYETVEYLQSFSDNPGTEGFCIAGMKDQTWHVFDQQGREIFTIPAADAREYLPDVDDVDDTGAKDGDDEDDTETTWKYSLDEDGTAIIQKYNGDETEIIIPCELDGRKVTGIGEDAFLHSHIIKVTIPDSITSIGNSAFSYCVSLTSIIIPDSVTNIGYGAFSNCESLASFTIPDSVTSIGGDAFSGCISLTTVTIPDSVTSIGQNPFVECKNLAEIRVSPDHPYLTVADGVLFSKPDKKLICYPCAFEAHQYAIPKGTEAIGDNAFSHCTSLIDIMIPDSVTYIGADAFNECKSLTSITIPDGVTYIGSDAFNECKSLTSITIPDSVTYIGAEAFYGCKSLKSIIIPDRVKSIEWNTFSYCTSLTSVMIPDSVTSIENDAFAFCDALTSITIPDSVTSIEEETFLGCESLTVFVSHDSYAERYCKINRIRHLYTDEPISEETPEQTPDQKTKIPSLSKKYPGKAVKLHEFGTGNSREKITAYAGPGKGYAKSVRLSPNSQKKVTAYFVENEWVFACIVHSAGALYVYVPKARFDHSDSIPEIEALKSLKGKITKAVTPRWGPDDEFASEKDCAASKGTAVKVFFTEGEYSYCEYKCKTGLVRMWLPSAAVRITK